MKKFLLFIGLSSLWFTSLSFANPPSRLFFSLNYGYTWLYGSNTEGDLFHETPVSNQDHYWVTNESLRYQHDLTPQLSLGYHFNKHLSFLLSFQHISSVISVQQFLQNPGTTSETTMTLPHLAMTTLLAKGLVRLYSVHLHHLTMTPFVDLGVGATFWDLSNMQINSEYLATLSSSGTNLSYQVGLGVNNQVSQHLSFDYGLHYSQLARYKSSSTLAGLRFIHISSLKQALEASVFALSPYLGVRYTL